MQAIDSPIADQPTDQTLIELCNRAAAAVLSADPDDLAALAEAHTCFLQLQTEARGAESTGVRDHVLTSSSQAEKIVEGIILREADNAIDAIKTVGALITDIQRLLTSPSCPAPVPVQQSQGATQSTPQQPCSQSKAHDVDHLVVDVETVLNTDDVPLALEFFSEANTHIEAAEACLLKLEESPHDAESVNSIFRSFHTVKGVAGFLNFKQIGALAHAAENLLDLARKGQLRVDGPIVDLVLESIDLLKALLVSLEQAIKKGEAAPVEPRLPRVLTMLHAAARDSATPQNLPPATVSPTKVVAAAPDAAVASAAPVSPTRSITPPTNTATSELRPGEGSQGDGTVKVSTDRLDSLINMVGELVISQSMVSQDFSAIASGTSNHRVLRNLAHLGKITRELQDLSMSMRMVPVQGVFQKMARVVRDISRKAGKEIEFVVVGGETELDRNVVEAIGDPLVHMVRNSVDHGIERPDERLAAGKPRTGKLELRARHQAGQIIIEISDDGRGLNTDKILKKAISNGIVSADDQLTEQQIFQLIFAAGLSTADQVTDISGRGVGMDVVRKNVEALRGRIDIQSSPGKGTTFAIHLPLTLAVIDGMVVRVGNERYIIPITSIEQSIRPKAEQISTIQGRGEMCLIRDRLMPLTRLHELFKITPRHQDPTNALVVIVHDNQRRCCLLVDELLGQQQVVIKSLGDAIGPIRGVSGGAILGDGEVSLILDVPGLIDHAA